MSKSVKCLLDVPKNNLPINICSLISHYTALQIPYGSVQEYHGVAEVVIRDNFMTVNYSINNFSNIFDIIGKILIA